ncbi:uncharacterized protein LOC116350391 [Contarinia nasturtii]|uniref:uncharacterized protein LOC116350391 n=1 Tax=Contarinia nasturtii TaxID=265458 RepID=UPI0012D3810B|nr:uncharacterized protein LOC116350391 [Contarinia nasturtii]
MFNQKLIILIVVGAFITQISEAAPKQSEIEWPKFNASDSDGNELVEYRIGWLPKAKYQEALDLMAEYMYRENPFVVAFDWGDDADVLNNHLSGWSAHLDKGISVACFKNSSDELIGVNILYIEELNQDYVDPEKPVTYPKDIPSKFRNLMKLTHELHTVQRFNVFEKYGVKRYLSSDGLVVRPEYRHRGIASQLLGVRKMICAKYNLKLTSTVFTSDASNALAVKMGYELDTFKMYADIFSKLPEQYNVNMTEKPEMFSRRSIKFFN